MRQLLAIITLLAASLTAMAQTASDIDLSERKLPVLRRVYAGARIVTNANGELEIWADMLPIIVYPNERFRNKKEEEFYWRTVRDVKRTLPYAKLINRTLRETYEYLETFDSKKEKDEYLKKFEKELYAQYKPVMKKLTKGQGKMMDQAH